jgi:predicted P-loop ATPase
MLDTWINEVGELGATFRRSDRDALKFFLTMQTVKERRPYAHYDTDGIARTSFIGTINDEGGFLTDPTGNRRYMISSFTQIDWAYTREVNVQQIWAQALALYRKGETWNLSKAEVVLADEINDMYVTQNPEDDYLQQLFEIESGRRDWWESNKSINAAIDISPPPTMVGKLSAQRVAKAWRRLGAEPETKRVDGMKMKGWVGIKRRPIVVSSREGWIS